LVHWGRGRSEVVLWRSQLVVSAGHCLGVPDDGLSGESAYENACGDRRSTYRPIVWTLTATGGVLPVVGLSASGKREPAPNAA
jgi:hypothetical protein